MSRNHAGRVCQNGQRSDASHDLEAQIFITSVAEHRTVYGGVPVYQRRAVGTERLNMARFQENAIRTMKQVSWCLCGGIVFWIIGRVETLWCIMSNIL